MYAINDSVIHLESKLDSHSQVVNRWLSIRLELMGQTMVLGTAVFVTLMISDAGLAGLAITSALSLVSIMNWATRQTTELEMGMNSVERVTEYLAYDSERPAIVPGNRCVVEKMPLRYSICVLCLQRDHGHVAIRPGGDFDMMLRVQHETCSTCYHGSVAL